MRTTEPDLYEPPKVSHKKKTDREREKERLEKELVEKAKDEYRIRQQEKGRPVVPREPLKRTADNNWVHVYCALWHPETKFSSAVRLDMVEGIGAPTLRYDAMCKLCKSNDGACVTCQQCHANFHVGCAHNAGYTFGFDMTPVKATRRDAVPTVTLNGETGTMMAAIWCKDHTPKTVVHPMYEEVQGTELTALQLYAREFKQADLTLTGTARKANLVDQSTRTVPPAPALSQGNRRTSTVTAQTPVSARGRPSNAGIIMKEEELADMPLSKLERKCIRCKIDASPRWWKVEESIQPEQNGTRLADALTATNGIESSSRPSLDHPSHPDHAPTNGTVDHGMTDAPSVAAHDHPTRHQVSGDTRNLSPASYLCQKCHWKKLNAPDELEERRRSVSVHPEAAQLPLRSPPVQPFVAPPPPPALALGGPWVPPPPQQPTTLPHWHNGGPPGPPHPHPHSLHNGIGHPPTGSIGHAPPLYAPYSTVHQPNGFPAYSAPPVHAHIPPAPLRGPYAPPHHHNGPPPLHLANGGMMTNGMHSPRVPYSPTHAHGHNSSRSTESPYNAPPPLSYPPIHHGTPPTGGAPAPRDAPMRDAAAATAPPPAPPLERVNTGASASPSLRNLLH